MKFGNSKVTNKQTNKTYKRTHSGRAVQRQVRYNDDFMN